MRVLVMLLLVVAVVVTAPKKLTKDFPKKYDSSIHNGKDTYSLYHHVLDDDMVVPEFTRFETLFPQFPLPEDSYAVLSDPIMEDPLSPPLEDTYSFFSDISYIDLIPPTVSSGSEPLSSYQTYEKTTKDHMKAPPVSTYAETPKDASSTEVLASLAAMIQALPRITSYSSYHPAVNTRPQDTGPARSMLPPLSSSSYSNVPVSRPSPIPLRNGAVSPPSIDLAPPQ